MRQESKQIIAEERDNRETHEFNSIIATTHTDKEGDTMTFEALESIVLQIKKSYIPVYYEHNDSLPPIGRIIDAKMVSLPNNHFGVGAAIEYFDRTSVLNESKFIKHDIVSESFIRLEIDKSYEFREAHSLINKINSDILKNSSVRYSVKKSIDPISVLTVFSGIYIIGKIFEGFLTKIGEDLYEKLKQGLSDAIDLQKERNERVLKFSITIKNNEILHIVNVFINNPSKEDISFVMDYGFKSLDKNLHHYLRKDIHEINLNYQNKAFQISYILNNKAIPFIPDEKYKKIDIII